MSGLDTVHGAFVVDKPAGRTSSSVVQEIKKHFSFRRVGHAGTLDPMATGVLVVLVGKATKIQRLFLDSNKAYRGEILLGQSTTTDDIEGDVLERDDSWTFEGNAEEICRRLERKFSGKIEQVPPRVSAVHVDGKRGYKRARRGEDFQMKPRSVHIEALSLGVLDSNRLSYFVRCSKGTYVRSLARDIGSELGTFGTLAAIRRTESGSFHETHAMPLGELFVNDFSDNIISIEDLLGDYPSLEIGESELERLRMGDQSPLSNKEVSAEGSLCSLLREDGTFQGLIQKGSEGWKIRFML